MDKFINPVIYKKEQAEIEGMLRTGLYFQDESGRDWYETLRTWKGAVATDENGIVVACESDVSFMGMQEGRNVYEINPADIPANVLGNFKFSEGTFIDIRPSDADVAEQKKSELMAVAERAIAPLQDAVDLDIATTEEKESLLAWKKYRVLLNRVNVREAPDLYWPETPQ
ncbi:tail fiber assembly protein [Enterobacter ludwigii]|uniref:tail fiber assembly protein n=1 Tax=Enterobacter ludwigii TaxID=299767 RepID=UPI0028BCB75F|nr:tail fiber assembly protein [Enterobacter ludwigii]ELI8912770.1 tail fiber assembly protein [Enterobacter kobei]ELI8917566.1 tail fiber assembly protein [Enterobacter kobei]